ncbi:MAG: AAA-like domain-containing protein [Cyanobacteriota bacterium]
MNTALNLAYEYQIGGSLPSDAPSYVVREADSDFYNGLKAGEFCYVLNSRQMGKSSLRVRTMKRLQAEGIACATIDIAAIGIWGITPEQWYAGMIDSIVSSLELYETFDLGTWWTERDLLSNVQRLSKFIEEVLLKLIPQNIVIFVDEIDSILSLNFNSDDFFAVIRDCYNKRADRADYRRLTFALIGVATPSDLIADKRRTPFNIGRAIAMTGFQLYEAQPLAVGLALKASNPQKVLQAVLDWTGGQPFLTQKVCQLIQSAESEIAEGCEQEWVEKLVRSRILEMWEAQDEPEHLKTIRDRILRNEQCASHLLGLYQQILQQGEVIASDSPEQMELRLTGLVVKREGKLKVYNRIYESVFDKNWVEKELANLRPYAEAITAWLASDCEDKSRLLRGKALQEAIDWKVGKSLSHEDVQFLDASRELEKRDFQRALAAAQKANSVLDAAQKKAYRLIGFGASILTLCLVGATMAGVWASNALRVTRIEKDAATALQQFNVAPIDALLSAMESGQGLQTLVNTNLPLENYPTVSPLLALQTILDNIRQTNQIDTYQKGVNSLRFFQKGKQIQQIATAGDDGKVKLWNRWGQQLSELKAHPGSSIKSVEFSSDEQKFATAATDGTAKLWELRKDNPDNLKAAKLLAQFKGHQGSINNVRLMRDGNEIVTTGEDGTLRLWALNGKQRLKIQAHNDSIKSLNISPNGKQIATAGEDGMARLWDVNGKLLAEFKGHQRSVNSVWFNPDNKQLVTAGNDGTIRLWNLNGKQLKEFKAHESSAESVRFSPLDGKQLATSGNDGAIRLWDIDGKLLAEFNGHQGSVESIRFSPDGKQLATAGKDDGTIRLWNVPEKQWVKLEGHEGSIHSARVSLDNRLVATAGKDGRVRLWDVNGKLLKEFKAQDGSIESIRFSSPDGKQLATSGMGGRIRLWNLEGKLLKDLNSHQPIAWSINFSPDGKLLASVGNDGTVKLLDLNGKLLASPFKGNGRNVESIKFSPDGKQLAMAGDDGKLRLWNLNNKQLKEIKIQKGSINSVSFSPDGKELAIAGDDGKVRRWDLSGKLLAEFNSYQGSIKNISFSPDGKLIATVGDYGTVRLWTLSGKLLAEFKGHQNIVRSLSFSPDGKLLVTAEKGGTAIVWRVRGLDELLAEGCDWLNDYFDTHPDALKKVEVCKKRE